MRSKNLQTMRAFTLSKVYAESETMTMTTMTMMRTMTMRM